MKESVKKIFKAIFYDKNSVILKLNISLFITAIIFSIFALLSQEISGSSFILTIISAFYFSIWLILIKGSNSIQKFLFELSLLYIFFVILLLSIYGCLNFILNYNSSNIIVIIASSLGLFCCIFYLTSKLIIIFSLIKKVFTQIKLRLYNTNNPAPTKIKTLIENITAFLAALGALTIAIRVIVESIFQIISYFKLKP